MIFRMNKQINFAGSQKSSYLIISIMGFVVVVVLGVGVAVAVLEIQYSIR